MAFLHTLQTKQDLRWSTYGFIIGFYLCVLGCHWCANWIVADGKDNDWCQLLSRGGFVLMPVLLRLCWSYLSGRLLMLVLFIHIALNNFSPQHSMPGYTTFSAPERTLTLHDYSQSLQVPKAIYYYMEFRQLLTLHTPFGV